ncbi:MAG TPA: DUF1648 domain-containing protein [Candidatus Sulfotelmatobacter sp.]
MNRTWLKAGVLLMWLALPISAWEYRSVWEQLPARMAVHFDANWRPNGYTSRQGALELGLGIMGVMLVIFTLSTLILDGQKPAAAWSALLIGYVVVSFCWYGNHSIVKFNLNAQKEQQRSQESSQLSVFCSRFPNSPVFAIRRLRTKN